MSFADLLREVRGGETQAAFARRMGLTQPQLSKYERGRVDSVPVRLVEACLARYDSDQRRVADTLATLRGGSAARRASVRAALVALAKALE